MKQVTRDIDPSRAHDLFKRIPRARLAFVNSQEPQAIPVRFVWRDDHYLVGIHDDTRYLPDPDQEVALLIDEGIYYFELRAVYVRGRVKPIEASSGLQNDCTWFEVIASRIIAWDYGAMREVQDEG